MNPETLKALQESIAHWERLASGNRNKGEEVSVYDCDLCKCFNTPIKDDDKKCIGCPVFEKTNQKFCRGTPFYAAENLCGESEYGQQHNLDSDEFKDAAELELEFLRSLLPPSKGEV